MVTNLKLGIDVPPFPDFPSWLKFKDPKTTPRCTNMDMSEQYTNCE